MNQSDSKVTRRDFAKLAGGAAAAVAATSALNVPHVFAQVDETIRLALIGCGGRGTGAAGDAMAVSGGPIKLVAMADVFEDRLKGSYNSLSKSEFKGQVDVPDDRKFIGFDGFKRAMDCLKPNDIAIFTTPPAFRWVFFQYAVEKGLNVFLEKPVTVDGPTSKRMLEINKKAIEKNLKVGVGLMCRHCKARQELFSRIKDGEIGDINTLRAYRMHGPVGSAFSLPKPDGISHTMYQIRQFHSFLWASGGCYSDFYIHNIDECCWMKDAWPVKAQASGGRHYRGNYIDQNFDNYSVEYTFADGAKLFLYGRCIDQTHNEFASYAHGSKGSAQISVGGHSPTHARTFKTQNLGKKEDMIWAFPGNEPNPYRVEWVDLVDAVRQNKKYNEVERGVMASAVTSMGRMAAHTGQVVTMDQLMNCDHEFAPNVDKLTPDGEPPLKPLADGKYPIPQPGKVTKREYQA